jgi:hypothetical protein
VQHRYGWQPRTHSKKADANVLERSRIENLFRSPEVAIEGKSLGEATLEEMELVPAREASPQVLPDTVPAELKLQILKESPDIPSLQALTRASPAYHEIYRSHRQTILSAILATTLSTSVQIEVYYLLQARELVGFENIKDFLALYEADRKLGAGINFPGLPLESVLEMTEDVSRVYKLAEIYARFALGVHPVTKEVQDDYENLSENEMSKLLGALLRVEMFCVLSRACEEEEYDQIGPYRFVVSTRTLRYEMRQLAQGFISSFSTREIEEIGCIRDWTYRYYWSILEDREAREEKRANCESYNHCPISC